ncbi:hypothetical protein HKX48_008241 [Thoreauomyces humboldtii]|nr:hypothetical protein HKX48_008241 [Thoreauomyces humboldtii]
MTRSRPKSSIPPRRQRHSLAFKKTSVPVLTWGLLVLFLSLCTVPRASASSSAASDESYDEKLHLTQLADGKVLAEFRFSRRIGPLALAQAAENHYSLLPRAVGEITQSFGVEELHLTFTQGNWNYARWGYSPLSAAAGVQLWSWFDASRGQWKGLVHALAGLFCASLNQMDESTTAQPILSFLPESDYLSAREQNNTAGLEIRYGSLPHETVCTENLTPWAKLLPCQTKAGIASLFNAYRLFDGHYHSMGIHVQPECAGPDCNSKGMLFVQTLSVVLDPLRLDNSKDWSLMSLFERQISSSCALAASTTVKVTVPSSSASTFVPAAENVYNDSPESLTGEYPIKSDTVRDFNIGVDWQDGAVDHTVRARSHITAHRYQTGFGGERGGLATDLRNSDPTMDQRVRYFDVIPWYLKVYLHTLTAETTAHPSIAVVEKMYFQPAIDRGRPAVLELEMLLPANSTTTLHIDYDKAFIKYTEHPPDANRGFDIGSAVVTLLSPSATLVDGTRNGEVRRLFTETLLVSLPTPDFSMPYNVITLTCTLMALFFGSVFNMLTRRYEPVIVKS